MEFGKFPWAEILGQTIPVIMGYFAGRYRNAIKKKDL